VGAGAALPAGPGQWVALPTPPADGRWGDGDHG
jgi:hypothetical protein